jgi:hypothetical protein
VLRLMRYTGASHHMHDMITVRLLDHMLLRQTEGLGAGLALVAMLIVARPFITAPARPGVF